MADYNKIAIDLINMLHSEEKEWENKLTKDTKGKVKNEIGNYLIYLNESDSYKGRLKFNEYLWQKEIDGKEFTDFDQSLIYNNCERETGLSSHSKIDTALDEVFYNNKYNPVVDYINSLNWDGKERISKLFIDLLDADDTVLNREMTKKWFIAAIKRTFEPGSKFDNIVVLQGNQGIGKSTICELLSKSFFNTISLSEIGNKDLISKLNKTWIAIIDELDTFNKKEMSTIKTFLSLNSDTARLAYGHNTQTFKRHCVFIGSTNDSTFLRDSTSSVERRFWIIKCNKLSMDGKIREVMTEDFVNQCWAEAVHYYNSNPSQYLDIDKSLQDEFANTMKEFKTYNDDKVIDYIKEILDKDYNLDPYGEFNDSLDFYNQCCGNTYYENQNCKINKIPMSALLWVLKKVYQEDRAGKYIGLALSSEWEYKTIKYKGKSYKGLYRKEQICSTNIKQDEELPF